MTQIYEALLSLVPNSKHVVFNNTYDGIDWQDERPMPTEAEVIAEITRLDALVPWNELRTKRNQLLAETDYFANTDVTMPDSMQSYRQALRDLPANTTDPANPIWPTKPSV